MNHSPRPKTDAPNHDDMKTPTKNMNAIEVMNPSPNKREETVNQKKINTPSYSFHLSHFSLYACCTN